MNPTFKHKLATNHLLTGTMITLNSPETAELLSLLGFDWFFIDGEHSPISVLDIQRILQAIGNRAATLVRVASSTEESIKKALDIGCDGIIYPQVNTVEQVKNIVKWSKYSPQGQRGMGLTRAHGYGIHSNTYAQGANIKLINVIQFENIKALKEIDEMLSIEGIDAVLVGPYDLSASLGLAGKVNDPKVIETISIITEKCLAAHMPLGIFGVDAEAVLPYIQKGYNLIVSGVDTLLLAQSAKLLLKSLKTG